MKSKQQACIIKKRCVNHKKNDKAYDCCKKKKVAAILKDFIEDNSSQKKD